MHQVEMVSLEALVPDNHNYRKFCELWNFTFVDKKLKKLEKANPYKGYGMLRLFKCLLLQFMENLSDRELSRYLQENTASKWFCGFNLCEKTPDYTVFTKTRHRIGTKLLSTLFSNMRDQLKAAGYMNEVFSFVDATSLIAKATLWKERDEAIKQKYDRLNNEVLPKVAADTQARIGCKGKDKYWYGYKRHVSVDMQTGLINKIATTPANVADGKGFKHVCPEGGAVYMDKAYCTQAVKHAAARKQCHVAAIKKNNMKGKNKDLDCWYSSIRSPYESTFSKQNKRVRYRGVAKNQFAAFMEAICFNLKKLVALGAQDLCLS
jgi:IS5 family transposase